MNDLLEEQKEAFLTVMLRTAGNISEACKKVGICRATFYNWRNDDPVFAVKIQDIQLSMIDMAESKLMQNIVDGKETSLIFFLTNRAPERWKHKDVMKVEQKTGVFIANGNPNELTQRIREIHGDDTPEVARRIADALGIPIPSGTPEITE